MISSSMAQHFLFFACQRDRWEAYVGCRCYSAIDWKRYDVVVLRVRERRTYSSLVPVSCEITGNQSMCQSDWQRAARIHIRSDIFILSQPWCCHVTLNALSIQRTAAHTHSDTAKVFHDKLYANAFNEHVPSHGLHILLYIHINHIHTIDSNHHASASLFQCTARARARAHTTESNPFFHITRSLLILRFLSFSFVLQLQIASIDRQ